MHYVKTSLNIYYTGQRHITPTGVTQRRTRHRNTLCVFDSNAHSCENNRITVGNFCATCIIRVMFANAKTHLLAIIPLARSGG